MAKNKKFTEQQLSKLSAQVEAFAQIGIPVKMMAKLLNISHQTIYSHFEQELLMGKSKACVKVANTLFNLATNYDGEGEYLPNADGMAEYVRVPHAIQFQAAKYIATTQMGWSEAPEYTLENRTAPIHINFITPEYKEIVNDSQERRPEINGQTTSTDSHRANTRSAQKNSKDERGQVQELEQPLIQATFVRH